MRARLIVPAVLGAFVLSTAAFAAGTTTNEPAKDQNRVQTAAAKLADRCTALQSQFDEAIKTHGSMAMSGKARALRSEGGTLCGKGEHGLGVVKIEEGLKDIGVTPSM